MITLYGFAVSNYYNKVKLVLLEKQIEFTEEMLVPSQDEAVLKRSPLGKIPFIQTATGQYLSESQAIVEYLEEAFPEHSLYPQDVFARAKCRELIQHLELNIELIARRLYTEAFFGGKVSQEIKDEVKVKVETGLSGVAKLLLFAPYAIGEQFSLADVSVILHLQMVAAVSQIIYSEDLVAKHIPGFATYLKQLESNPNVQKVIADRNQAIAEFLKSRN